MSTDAIAPTRPAPPTNPVTGRRSFLPSRRFLLLLVVLAAFFAIWEAGVHFTGTYEIILPKPSSIFKALVVGFSAPVTSRANYLYHAQQSFSQILEYLMRPFIVAINSMPKIALAPVLIIWFGLGFNSKFVLVILATFFPLFVNGVTGFRSVEEGPLRLMRSFGATPRQIFTKLTFPTALPFIFAGLEIGMVHAITSGIAAEFLGGQRGLGTMMLINQQVLDVPGMFSVLFILAFIGWLMSVIIRTARRRVVYWAPETRATRTIVGVARGRSQML